MSPTLRLLAIPTGQRPAELRRAIASFAAHLHAHGRRIPIGVFHSPRNAAEQAEVQGALHGLVPPGAPEPLYVGIEEKVRLAKELRRATRAPPELLELALFNPTRNAVATGANRNAILLWGAGGRILSTDDDTLAELSVHPQLEPAAGLLREVVAGDPADCFVPPDGDLSAFRLRPDDPRSPAGGLAGAVESVWDACRAAGTPAPLVFPGLAGDCGWAAPFGFFGMPFGYLLLRTPTLERLTATPEGWQAVLCSRRMLRAVPRPLLSRGGPGMTTTIGIDASGELPPFLPVGRGEDLLFCAMVERLGGAPSAHLPLAVAHEPLAARRFHDGELWRAAQSLDLCRTFLAFLDTLPAGADLPAFGRHLRAQAAGGDDSFAEALQRARRQHGARLVAEARAAAAARPQLGPWWQQDLERFCQLTEQALASPDPPWVLDAGGEDAAGSLRCARLLVERYGALCEAWPALWSAAREPAGRAAPAAAPGAAPAASAVAAVDGPWRCSPYQTWLWRLQRLDPDRTSYVIFRALRGSGPLREDLLEQAVRALVRRHEALRCRLVEGPDDEPLLDLRPPEELVLRRLPPLDAAERARGRAEERTRPFDLTDGLPLRLALVPEADAAGRWELWLAAHHAALDGVGEDLFWRELETLYGNLLRGAPAEEGLAPLRASFREIARRQRAGLTAALLEANERHWRERMAGAPEELRISWRIPEPGRGSDAVRRRTLLPAQLAEDLRRLARERQTSVAALCLAAWQALLTRWSGETDLVVAVDFANRWDEAEEEQIALFMTALPVRVDLSGDPTMGELAQQTRARLAEAFAHGRIPFDRLARALGSGRRRFSLFQALFTHLVRASPPRLAGSQLELIDLDQQQSGFDLGLTTEEEGARLSAVLSGSAALFDQGDLERLGGAFAGCLSQLCQDPGTRLSQLSWTSDADRARLAAWNATDADYPRDQPLPALLRRQAELVAEAVALEGGGERITYRELWRRAEVLAARLRARGVGRDVRVGLFLDRHPRMLEAMLGVLEAGGGYLPLDPAFPRDRLAFMIADAAVPVLVTRTGLLGELPPHSAQVVCVDGEEAAGPTPPGWLGPAPDSLAYLLYTSGSTGRPKGVEVTHRALVNFLCSMARAPGLSQGDVLLALTTLSFDIAGLELWLPQLVGARIALAGREEAADGEKLKEALDRSRATVLQATPSTWRQLFGAGWPGDPRLKALVGGEALPPDLAQRLADGCAEAWNLYGPTETTIWSTAWRIPHGGGPVRIGTPIANTRIHVLDELRRPLPPGVTGELYIGGDGVARGYLNRPELDAERFLPDPFLGGGARLYRTGDLARWLPEGTLEFLGRNDAQLKLRGYRIEPGEVEAALLQLPEVAQAAVGLHQPASGDPRLVAWLVPRAGAGLPGSAELRARLRRFLLEHMLPLHFVAVEALPLTANGKVDRKRLSSLFRAPPDEAPHEPGPLTPLEAELASAFSELLGRPVGPDADFFEAGGDSISALRLIGRISRQHGGSLAGADLFLHSTPRRLAGWLRQQAGGGEPVAGHHLVLLRKGGGRLPVFFVHPVGGELLPYVRLAQHLDAALPLYGLQATRASPDAYASLGERCAAYARELLAAWSGPLALGGYSLGGVLALEVAEQLRRAGREVKVVFLFDASVPWPERTGMAKLRFRLRELRRFSWGDRRCWARAQLARLFGPEPPDPLEGIALDAARMQTLREQALRWAPPPYGGSVLLFRAERHVRGYTNPPGANGWDRSCSRLEIIGLPCDHTRMVSEPFVGTIAREIDRLTR